MWVLSIFGVVLKSRGIEMEKFFEIPFVLDGQNSEAEHLDRNHKDETSDQKCMGPVSKGLCHGYGEAVVKISPGRLNGRVDRENMDEDPNDDIEGNTKQKNPDGNKEHKGTKYECRHKAGDNGPQHTESGTPGFAGLFKIAPVQMGRYFENSCAQELGLVDDFRIDLHVHGL